MNQQEYFKKLREMPETAKVALIVTMISRLEDIIETKGKDVMRVKAQGLLDSCNRIIDISYEVAKED